MVEVNWEWLVDEVFEADEISGLIGDATMVNGGSAVAGIAEVGSLLNGRASALLPASVEAPAPLGGRVALVIGRRVPPPIGVALSEMGAEARLATSEHVALEMASSSAPPLVFVELQDDERSAARVGRAVTDRSPFCKLVLVDGGDDLHAAAAAARAGFHGYVASDASPERAIVAIQAALDDHFMVPRRVAQIAFDVSSPEEERARVMAQDLTAREWEVLALLTEGESNREIGGRLGISPHTVRAHIGKILAKLDARDRLEAATFAMRHKLVPERNGRSTYGSDSLS